MAKVNVPAEPQPRITVYGEFKGVDFSTDPYLVDNRRSPYAINIISDKGGQPEKRPGWETVHTMEQPINGLAYGFVNGQEVFIAHGGTKLYQWTDTTATVIRETVANTKSAIFFMPHQNKSKLFVLTGSEYMMYDGETVKSVSEEATIPVVLIAKKPNGGGTSLQPINLIQPKRTEKFAGNGTDKVFVLGANNLDATVVAVKQVTATGETALAEGTAFTVDRVSGKITFVAAPPVSTVTGEDNIMITYAKTVEGYADRVCKCRTVAHYGLGGSNRVFITRNPDCKAQDWWCEMNDPTYFPDTNYAVIGTDNTSIMGYSKIGEYLAIIKEDNQQDTTIFVRRAELTNGVATFPVKPGVTGIGALSPHSFAALIDEPLFLARTGIYAITSNVVTAERTLQNRSFFVDPKLTKEPNLQDAVATEWNGYYLIAVNGHAYLMDSRQRSEGRNPSNFYYECYYWENVPAIAFLVHNGELFFGTPDGKICKFKSNMATMARFSDGGDAIVATWSTKADDDGLPCMSKTMTKKGCLVTLKPFHRSGVKISVKTEKDTVPSLIAQGVAGILDFDEIDFTEFTFISNDNARAIVFRKKIKKYRTLQFFAVNDRVNQGFGLFNIVKSYVPVNYIKR